MSQLDEKLIADLISRVAQELPFYKVSKRGQQHNLLQHNEKALVDLSGSNQIDIIARGLSEQLDKLVKQPPPTTEENMVRLVKSQLHLLNLLQRCLSTTWDNIKQQFDDLKGGDMDQDERIRLKEKVEGVLPPPINEDVAKKLYALLVHFLTSKSIQQLPGDLQAELQKSAAKCFFQFSASNSENITPLIIQFIGQANAPEEDILAHIYLLEHLNQNSKQLAELLARINKIAPSIKKSSVQITLAKVLRRVIWNWVDHYPIEFVNLCKSGRIGGNPDQLFDLFESWANNTAKKANFWPICTMLLILCPDVMLKVVLDKETGATNTANKAKFLDSLKKGMSSSKLSDVVSICYVDISKASTYVSKSDTSALRYIVVDIEAGLKEKLFNPASKVQEVVDEQMMIDWLLSSFYLSPRKVVNSLFADCVKQSSPPLFKRVLVKALYQIASESTLPWNPSINDVYAIHAGPLRQMFQDFLTSLREYDSVKNATDKKAKLQLEKVLVDIGILTKLISLYKVDPVLALYPLKSATQDLEDIRCLLTGLCDCVAQFDMPELSSEASAALLTLHRPENIQRWCPKQGIEGFWAISSSVNICLASIVSDRIDLEPKSIYSMIHLLETILSTRIQFLSQAESVQPDTASKKLRLLASTKLESAFLLHLGSGDIEIVAKCANSFRLLCDEIDILQPYHIDETDNSIIANFDAYKQLATSAVLSTGRQAQQKAIRTILKSVQRQTAGNYAAWDEVCHRWQILTVAVKSNEEGSSQGAAAQSQSAQAAAQKREDAKRKRGQVATVDTPHKLLHAKNTGDILLEWTNSLGILCSLGAVTIQQGSSRSIGARAPKATNCSTPDEFLHELMGLLVSEYVNIRETAKMMLGNALSPDLYTFLFRTLHREAKQRLFGDSEQVLVNNTSILFVDQAVSAIKLILEGADRDLEELSLVTEFEDLLLLLVKFVRQLTISASSLQVRHKLCGLLETVVSRRNVLTFRNEYQLRTDMVENVIEWTSEFSTKEANIPADLPAATLRQVQKLIKELDAQALQAISGLLRGMPLQGKDDEAKSNLFSKFFNFFTNLLTRCKKSPQTVLTPQLPEATIQALSFLVTANIEHGLEYFITMGYHRDYETRSAFLKVLTNILKERTDFDAGEDTDKYYKLQELILDPQLSVVLTLCNVTASTDADATAHLLVRIFEANERTMDLLKAVITAEVQRTEAANTLFRGNSMATKLMAAYCMLIGRDYLRVALGPQMKALLAHPLPMEVNPAQIGTQSITENQQNVLRVSEAFLADIEASIPQCPAPFREICRFLRQTIGEKFPGHEHTAIAGFMFLRFLGPAIVAPDGFGVFDAGVEIGPIRRNVVLIAKIVQNLANRTLFKEPFMQFMNTFIEDKTPLIRHMFDVYALTEGPGSDGDLSSFPTPPPVTFTDEQREEDLGRLHFYCAQNLDKMAKSWSTPAPSSQQAAPTSNALPGTEGFLSYLSKEQLEQAPPPKRKPEPANASATRAASLRPERGHHRTPSNASGSQSPHQSATTNQTEAASSSPIDRLTNVLAQLGAPPALPTKNVQVKSASGANASASKDNIHYEKFMSRMAGKNTKPIEGMEVFYQHGKSKKQVPIFYYIARQYETGCGIEDLLLYHILNTMQASLSKKYSIVVDLTHFSGENCAPSSLCNTFVKIMPAIAQSNLEHVYFVHANQTFKKYSKSLSKHVSRISKRFVFCARVSQLYEHIGEAELKLPVTTMALEKTIQATFSPVTKVTQYNKKDVKVVICAEVLQLVTLKPYAIFGHPVALTEAIHVSAFGDISSYKDSSNFVVKYYEQDGSQKSVELGSAQSADQIMQQLIGIKDRYKISQPQNNMRSKAFRPSDVPGTLLNMALLNLTVATHELRVAAYNLLVALCSSFGFKINTVLLEAHDLAIPKNSRHFTVRVSTELAQSEPSMTLEFLQQSLDGISNADRVSQVLVLDYITPWLWNLGKLRLSEDNQAIDDKVEAKMREIFSALISLSVREADEIGPAILPRVWKILGECDHILDYILESLLSHSTSKETSTLGTKTMDCFEDIIVTVAAENSTLFAGKLLALVIQTLDSLNATQQGGEQAARIEQYPCWVRFEVLTRWMLVLSFDNLLSVHEYLPEVWHVIVMLFFSGDTLIRSGLYAIFFNTVHSLLAARWCHEEKTQHLRLLFHQYHEVHTQLQFGIGGKNPYSPFLRLSDRDGKLESFPITIAENITDALFQVMNCGAANVSCIGTPQHARWLKLTREAAFNKNPLLQPRAICALGILCQSTDLVTDELVGNLLRLLKDALSTVTSSAQGKPAASSGQSDDLAISVISCLSRMFAYLNPKSQFYHQFFWIAMSLCQMHDTKVFTASIQLLENVVKVMSDYGCFKGVGLSAFVMKSRTKLDRHLDKLDSLTGISFKHNFSFAAAAHLLKGLKNVGSKAFVTRLLNTFVEYSRESNPANLLGYLASLLPHSGDNISNTIRQLLLSSSESGQSLFNTTMVPDKVHAALLFTFLVTILNSSESEHEQLYVYRALEDGVHYMPDSFPVTFDVLMRKMDSVVTSSQNSEILATVLNLTQAIYTYGLEATSVTVTLTKQYLDTVGFSGLSESDQFHHNKGPIVQVICTILESVL